MADRRRPHRHFGILDIGTSKIAAAVVVVDPGTGSASATPRLTGLGVQRSKGVKAGVLTDLDEAEHAVRAAISQAERAAGITVDSVTVSVACGRLKSQHFSAKADIAAGVVTSDDMDRALSGGRAYAERNGRALLHMNRLGVHLDGAAEVRDPRGLAAHHMAMHLHAVAADEAPLRNLLLLVDRCHLGCDGLVAAPYASALAATTAEEREIGVTCIDFGAGTTSMALFAEGRFVGAAVLAVGAQHVSFDIAKALQTPLVEAERIKTLYGTLISAQSDDYETISYPLAGEEDGSLYQTTRAQLTEIIRPRVSQILSLVRETLSQNEAYGLSGHKIVLTGGASQLLGAADFVGNELGRSVRTGKLSAPAGLNDSAAGPHLATLAGLAHAVARPEFEMGAASASGTAAQGYLGRVGSWLKAGF